MKRSHPTVCTVVALSGGTLAARISGRLDAGLAGSVAGLLRRRRGVRRVLLDASGLDGIDPVGAQMLSSALEREQAEGAQVEIHGLAAAFLRLLRRHPLRAFCDPDDALFTDPDLALSFELPASRH